MPISYSVVIPAFNEELFLGTTLEYLRRAMDPLDLKGEIIVVDNNSTDRTSAIAQNMGCSVVTEPINQISRARNRGAAAAIGNFLIFLDADTRISPGLLKEALDCLRGNACCGGGALIEFFENSASASSTLALRLLNRVMLKLSLAGGSFLYCTRDGFQATGGFNQDVYAAEDVLFSRRLKKWGTQRGQEFRIITRYPILSSDRKMRWNSTAKLFFMSAAFALFPLAVRYKVFCGLWYQRPNKSLKPTNPAQGDR